MFKTLSGSGMTKLLAICLLAALPTTSFGQLSKFKKKLEKQKESIINETQESIPDTKTLQESVPDPAAAQKSIPGTDAVSKSVPGMESSGKCDYATSSSNSDECNRYINSMKKMDDKVNLRLSEGKPKSAEMSLQSYNNYIGKMESAGCADVSAYQNRAGELQALITKGHSDLACSEVSQDIHKKDSLINSYLPKVNADMKSLTMREIADYERLVDRCKELGCISDDSEYRANAEKWKEQTLAAAIKSDPFAYYLDGLKENSIEMIEAAFKNGLELNTLYGSKTPLMAAAEAGNMDVVKHLIAKGADLNIANDEKKVALDYENEILNLSDRDIEIKLLLLEKGANAELANMYRIGTNLVDNKRFEIFKQMEAYPSVKFSTDNYASFYWESPKESEMQLYFAKKVTSGKIGKTFSSYKPGMKNSTLTAKMIKTANAADEYQYSKISIADSDWRIIRNQLTSIITHREIYTNAYGVTKHGVAFVDRVCFIEQYDGSKYGTLKYAGFTSKRTVDRN